MFLNITIFFFGMLIIIFFAEGSYVTSDTIVNIAVKYRHYTLFNASSFKLAAYYFFPHFDIIKGKIGFFMFFNLIKAFFLSVDLKNKFNIHFEIAIF